MEFHTYVQAFSLRPPPLAIAGTPRARRSAAKDPTLVIWIADENVEQHLSEK